MAVGSSNDFDLIILGAGTGGYGAAFRAAQLGLKVALVDEGKIGGTCLHIGCIPTKAMLESAAFAERLRHAKDFGLDLPGDAVLDYARVAARRDQVVKRMWTGLKTLVDKNKVSWIQGRGRLDGPRTVRVQMHGEDGTPGAGGERILQATDVILATGSRVKSLPGLTPDGKQIVTSDDVLRTDRLPKDIIVIGAGAVGVEFASMYHDFGVAVTLLEYLPAVVPAEDREVSQLLERSFTRRGIKVMTSARFDVASVKTGKDGVKLTVGPEGKEATEIGAELLLVATGRAPNVEDIGLETTKAELERGFIKVDGRMRTKEPHLYAIGDLVGGLLLAHTAAHEGLVAAHVIAGETDVHPIDYVQQPRATYCRPEIARSSATARRTTPWESTSWARTPPISSQRRRSHSSSTRRHGRSAVRRIRTRRSRRSSARPPWPSTVGRSTSETGGAEFMAVTRTGDSDLARSVGLTDADLVAMYRKVALARAVDERMWILNRAGRIPFVISGQGHEGAQVGIAWPLERKKDWIAPFYRSIATCLAFGMTAQDILMAQYAKATDPSSGGRQMPGHYGNAENNLVSLSSPVATQMLHAVGIALAAKIRKTGQVAMTSMGEGSSNQGDVHEGLNFAAIHKLPFILVIENNGYAISVPASMELATPDVADRASGYGIPGVVVDGSDVLACYRAAKEAVDRARRGDGPTLIEAKVIRLTAHSSDDQQTKYRPEQELAELRSHDALPRFRDELRAAGVLDDELEATIAAEIKAEVDAATEHAEAEPDPDPSTAMRWVYAEDWPSEVPPPWGLGGHDVATPERPDDGTAAGGSGG
jgi:2-oxoisovalerate dehydrogenase E1 component alpha subunit